MIQILLNILKTENQTISLSDKCLLEPYVLKGTRGVLRRVWESNLPLLSDPSLNISENIYTGWNFNPCCDGILSFEISSLVTNLGSCMRKMSNGTIVSIVSGLDKE